MHATYQIKVARIRAEATGIISLELVPADASRPLPPADSGSHVDLLLADGLRRSYSLYRPSDGASYGIAVQREDAGRGGSRHVHERIREGDALAISAPRNHFPLRAGNGNSVLVAGGIGITPIYAMLQTLAARGEQVRLIYCARSRAHAAFLRDIEQIKEIGNGRAARVETWFDDDAGTPDLRQLLAGGDPDAGYYCCGPAGMLDAFEKACSALGYKHSFIERFGAQAPDPASQDADYEVELARSGRHLTVRAGQSLLDVLLKAGIDVAYSCQEGACGSCETAVLAGDIDHRDCLLSAEERAAGNTMLVCVSGCRSSRLVLDL
ncbi:MULTISPECIES: PDR/VanB family oxidoreductase [Cupriavidus]